MDVRRGSLVSPRQGGLDGRERWDAVRRAHAGVLASPQESFGMAASEMLAAGRPMVLSSAVPMARAVADAGASVVAAAGDVTDIGNAVVRLAAMISGRPDVGDVAKAFARHRFDLQRSGEQALAAFVVASGN